MKTILGLYGTQVPEIQRSHFYKKIEERLRSEDGIARYQAHEALSELWRSYDAGGISLGRSMRAGLLEVVLFKQVDEGRKLKALSVLAGMYHDIRFVNRWIDGQDAVHFSDSFLTDRILIATALFALGLQDQIEDMDEWPEEKIRQLVIE